MNEPRFMAVILMTSKGEFITINRHNYRYVVSFSSFSATDYSLVVVRCSPFLLLAV